MGGRLPLELWSVIVDRNLDVKGALWLAGLPRKVGGSFSCYDNPNLINLIGAPQEVGVQFLVVGNPALTSLEGAPQTLKGDFSCQNNPALRSLQGAPQKVGGCFCLLENPALTSLKGGPQTVGESFECSCNHALTSLKGAPQTVGEDFHCHDNHALTSLAGLSAYIGGKVSIRWNDALPENLQTDEGRLSFKDYLSKFIGDVMSLAKPNPRSELSDPNDCRGTTLLRALFEKKVINPEADSQAMQDIIKQGYLHIEKGEGEGENKKPALNETQANQMAREDVSVLQNAIASHKLGSMGMKQSESGRGGVGS